MPLIFITRLLLMRLFSFRAFRENFISLLKGNQWWSFPWGGVWGGSKQTFVVCRYEEDPAREVSLVVKQQFHRRDTYPGWVLRVASMFSLSLDFSRMIFDVTIAW
jgi:hypothetical protein